MLQGVPSKIWTAMDSIPSRSPTHPFSITRDPLPRAHPHYLTSNHSRTQAYTHVPDSIVHSHIHTSLTNPMQAAVVEAIPDVDRRATSMANYTACCMPPSTNKSPHESVAKGPNVSTVCKPSSSTADSSSSSAGCKLSSNKDNTRSSTASVDDVVTATAFACYVSGFSPIWIPRACAAMNMLMVMLRDEEDAVRVDD